MLHTKGRTPYAFCVVRERCTPALRHGALARPRALHLLSTTPNEAVVLICCADVTPSEV